MARDYKTGDFVQILADDVRVERAWKNNQGNWISGSAVLLMTRIRKVTALTAGEQPAGNTAGNPPAENAGTRAEASVLDGVRVSDRAAEAEPELAAALLTAGDWLLRPLPRVAGASPARPRSPSSLARISVNTSTPRITLRSAQDVIAGVPYLMGFHPSAGDLVILSLTAGQVASTMRLDIPGPAAAGEVAEHLAGILERQRADSVVIIGYGPPPRSRPSWPRSAGRWPG